jgi:hypothetical protein
MLTERGHALKTHDHLLSIIQNLKSKYNKPRSIVTAEQFSQPSKALEPSIDDQNRTFDLAVIIMTSVCCSIENGFSSGTELCLDPGIWRSDESLQEFLDSTFPKRGHSSLNMANGPLHGIRDQLTATKLAKVVCLRFRGTDDIKNHLNLDHQTGIVEIYHYTSVLKEHMLTTREKGNNQSLDTPAIW